MICYISHMFWYRQRIVKYLPGWLVITGSFEFDFGFCGLHHACYCVSDLL